MSLNRVAFLGLVAVVMLVPLGSVAPAAGAKAKTHKVSATGNFPAFRFDPDSVEISVGDKVLWTNTTSSEHHIQPYSGPWAEGTHLHIDADGGKAWFRFTKPGEYKYYCDIAFHGQLLPGGICVGQCGSITVD